MFLDSNIIGFLWLWISAWKKSSLRHRKCGVRGFVHELFVSKTRTNEVRESEGFWHKQRVNKTQYKALSMSWAVYYTKQENFHWTRGVFTWENSHWREFHTGMTFWFRIAFTWWVGRFISCYLTVHFMLIKYTFASKSQTLRMRYPFQSTGTQRQNDCACSAIFARACMCE